MRKRHRYATVVVNGDARHTPAMVEHRSSAALAGFLTSQPHRRRAEVAVTDGSKAHKAAIDACLPHSRHVLDRFHVIRWLCAGSTAVRRDAQRRDPQSAKPVFGPEVFRLRFLLMRRDDQLDALDKHPRPKTGREALQELHGLPSRRPPQRPRRPRQAHQPLRHLPTTRIPRHRRHCHRMAKRDPEPAPHRPRVQRQNRRHRQPPPSPATNRPRLHQPHQPRRPRTPDSTTRQPTPTTPNPTLTRRPQLGGKPCRRSSVDNEVWSAATTSYDDFPVDTKIVVQLWLTISTIAQQFCGFTQPTNQALRVLGRGRGCGVLAVGRGPPESGL